MLYQQEESSSHTDTHRHIHRHRHRHTHTPFYFTKMVSISKDWSFHFYALRQKNILQLQYLGRYCMYLNGPGLLMLCNILHERGILKGTSITVSPESYLSTVSVPPISWCGLKMNFSIHLSFRFYGLQEKSGIDLHCIMHNFANNIVSRDVSYISRSLVIKVTS